MIAVAEVLPSDIDRDMIKLWDARLNTRCPTCSRPATVRDASPPQPKPSVTTGVSRCAAAPLEPPYATSIVGKPSSLVVKFFI
jgi:hypothetical protein